MYFLGYSSGIFFIGFAGMMEVDVKEHCSEWWWVDVIMF
jgi:hypothetical protein